MNILLIGSGGREHAIAWALQKSPNTDVLYVAPGNGGTAEIAENVDLDIADGEALLSFVHERNIGLVVIGPEAPLVDGVADLLRADGVPVFGPNADGAQLEGSKAYSKAFMEANDIPTAAYGRFDDEAAALAYVREQGAPIVIKADGLAAGKGVIVAMNLQQAHDAVDMMLSDNKLGDAGARVVIEEFLEGEEASFIVLVDGKNILPLATSQDHKRLLDNDAGPNTGGMGAYSPAPIVTPALHARVLREIITPTINGMKKDGIPFTGFLYAGLMIDKDGNPKTLEFNCRMGDPETQPILSRLKSDLVYVMEHAVSGTLDKVELEWDRRIALGVVLAAAGYPENPVKGAVITGIPKETENQIVFHAGTRLDSEGKPVTSGGRVLCVVGLADTMRMAQKTAYDAVESIHFDGVQYRHDIGWRALKSYKTGS